MYSPNVVTNTICAGLGGLADWLYGCAHRRTTFPMTLRASATVDGQQSTQLETYVACLACGRHLAYDWAAMRVRQHVWSRPPQHPYVAAGSFTPPTGV